MKHGEWLPTYSLCFSRYYSLVCRNNIRYASLYLYVKHCYSLRICSSECVLYPNCYVLKTDFVSSELQHLHLTQRFFLSIFDNLFFVYFFCDNYFSYFQTYLFIFIFILVTRTLKPSKDVPRQTLRQENSSNLFVPIFIND